MVKIKPSEITPEQVYLSRRRFIKGAGALVASSVVLAACGTTEPQATATTIVKIDPTASPTASLTAGPTSGPTTTTAPTTACFHH